MIEFVEVAMCIDSLSDLPDFALPEGFSFRRFREGDDQTWAAIESAAGGFPDARKARDHFASEFSGKEDELGQRCFFLLGPASQPVGMTMAWYDADFLGGLWGRLHWVAIVPDWQGMGLAKPLVSRAMEELSTHYDRAYLITQTTSYVAVKVYLDFGFRPCITDEFQRRGWTLLADILKRPALAEYG